MRTTLTIDDDVLAAAKAIAAGERKSVGEVLSALARRALHRPQPMSARNGVPLLPVSNPQAVVTLDIVNALRD
jgi:hypothetical protein